MRTITRANYVPVLSILNRNKITENKSKSEIEIKAMGLSACQGLCISYGLHSKRFCK